MRRKLISVVLFIFILTVCACAGTEVQRSIVDDNIFFSSSKPKIRIKLDPSFKLTKEDENSVSGFSTSGSLKSSNVKAEQYIFSGSGPKKNKVVMIEFQELISPKWQFNPTLFSADNVHDSGSIKIHGKNYQYMVFAFKHKSGAYNIIRGYGRRVGANNNAMIRIHYLERVTGDWSNLKMLSPEQQTHLNTFIEASKKDIQILNPDSKKTDNTKKVACELPIKSYVGGSRILQMLEKDCIEEKGKIMWYIEPLPPNVPHDKYIECLLPGEASPVYMKAGTCLNSQGRIANAP